MDSVVRISDVIAELKRLQVEHGDIPVYSVSFEDSFLTKSELPELSVDKHKEKIVLF